MIKPGQRYVFTDTDNDRKYFLGEVESVRSDKSVSVRVITSFIYYYTVGHLYTNEDLTLSIWKYLEGQDKPEELHEQH